MTIKTDEMNSDFADGEDRECQHCPDMAVQYMAFRGSDGKSMIIGYCQDCYDDICRIIGDEPDGEESA